MATQSNPSDEMKPSHNQVDKPSPESVPLSVKTTIYVNGVERDFQGQYLPDTEGGMFSKQCIFVDSEGEPYEITYSTEWHVRSLNPPPELTQRLNRAVSQLGQSQNAQTSPPNNDKGEI